MRPTLRLALILFALSTASVPASAQIGLTTDVITGVVTAEDSTPLSGAVVEVLSLETQIARTTRTDTRGRYTILFPDGGGQYHVSVRYIGMHPNNATIQRIADEDRLVWNVRLSASAVILEGITVRAPPRAVVMPDIPTPGSIERSYTPEIVSRLPIDPSDLNLLAALVPGVISIPETDSSAAQFSVAGLRPDANSITLDGLSFGTGTVPQDGLRTTRVVTSTYDVARGSFSGGVIASTTRGGSNVLQGSSNYSLRDEDLAVVEDTSAFAQGYTQNLLSGGLGGPLVRNRLFLFGSFQARLRTDAQQTLLSATSSDLNRLGVSPDSVTRFLNAVRAAGVSPTQIAPESDRSTNAFSGLGRLDYLLSNSHTLTFRGDWRSNSQDPNRLSALSLPETGGLTSSSGGGGLVSLTSRFGIHVINDLHAYLSRSVRNSNPYLFLPNGRVQVASSLPNGTRGVATLTFGGSNAGISSSTSTDLEAADEISWLPGRGRHRIKLGGTLSLIRSSNIISANGLGTYSYNSLGDLENTLPATFRRTIVPNARTSHAENAGIYAGDVWAPTRNFQLTYGARAEQTKFLGAPAYNPVLDSLFNRRTDELPNEVHASPRAGFTWTIGIPRFAGVIPGAGVTVPQQGQRPARRTPALILRGGGGEFRSPVSSSLVAAAQSSTGLATSESQIVCTGTGVPTPDWTAYGANEGSIPTACLGGSGLEVSPALNATVFALGFHAPRAWRGSLGAERSLSQILRVTVDASYARGVAQYGFRDLNLVSTPRFTLDDEGGRPVYVPAGSIIPTTGAVPLAGSRVDPRFGQVLEISSDLASESEQLTTSLSGVTRKGILLSLSYTLAHSRDQSSTAGFDVGGFAAATTAGDPNVREWASSDFDRRNAFISTITYPFGTSIELTAIGRLNSGSHFTPLVGSDINGDGARNDRAFMFDPSGTSPEAAAMNRLLSVADGRIHDCLERQIGTVASRNSCAGPWQASFDLQLNLRPNFLGLKRRVMISVVTVNLLRGVDDLVHGSANAHGWGLTLRPDPTLLYVSGFDPATHQFSYLLNERFGATGSGANAIRSPFQIGIQGRLTLGPDRTRQALDALRGAGGGFGGRGGGGLGGGGGFGGAGRPGAFGGANPAGFAARLATILPNSAAEVLALKDSLSLTSEQVSKLEMVRDSFTVRINAIADTIEQAFAQAAANQGGTNQQPSAMLALVRPGFERGRAQVANSLAAIKEILTEQQWARIPDRIKNPRGPGVGQGQDGRGRGRVGDNRQQR